MHAEITTWMRSCFEYSNSNNYVQLHAYNSEICVQNSSGSRGMCSGIGMGFTKLVRNILLFRFSCLHHGGKKVLDTGEQLSPKLFSQFF